MKKDYCIYYEEWHKKVKGHPYLIPALLEANWKRQMTIQEGVLFLSLMKRTQNRRRHGRRTRYA